MEKSILASPRSAAWEARKQPKMYPLHYDAWQYYPDHAAVQEAVDNAFEGEVQEIVQGLGRDPLRPPKYKRPYRKIKAQFNDPICTFALTDLLIQMQRGIYVRPGYLRDLLNNRWPQYVWSNSLVGRMLAGMVRVCQSMYPEVGEKETPLARGRDSKGNYWVIDPKGGNEGLLWLVRARRIFADLCGELMDREAVMRVEALEGSLTEYERPEALYREVLSFRLRGPGNYEASWRPDITFGRVTQAREPVRSPYGD